MEGEDTEHGGKKSDAAKSFLHQTLANGPVPVSKVKTLSVVAGIAPVTLQCAKEAMNVISVKSKGDFVGGWDWMLPMQQLQTPAELLQI